MGQTQRGAVKALRRDHHSYLIAPFLQPSFHSFRGILSFFSSTLNVFSQPANRIAGERVKNTGQRTS